MMNFAEAICMASEDIQPRDAWLEGFMVEEPQSNEDSLRRVPACHGCDVLLTLEIFCCFALGLIVASCKIPLPLT